MSIFVAHQGSQDNGQLWHDALNGSGWAGDRLVPNTGLSASPSGVVVNGRLYYFHQGYGNDGQLWYNPFDVQDWTGDPPAPNTALA